MNIQTPRPPEVAFMGINPPQQPAFPTHLVYSNERRLLTPPECRTIIELAESKGFRYGTVGNGDGSHSVDDPDYRSVEVCDLNPYDVDSSGQDLKWLFAKVAERVSWANASWRFHLSGFGESFQLLKYTTPKDGRPAGHYRMHQDFGGDLSSTRKLSCVIQLSHATEYQGCRLHLLNYTDMEIVETCQGDMILFPSWTPHYVTPITEGTRYAIAVWVHGPQFV